VAAEALHHGYWPPAAPVVDDEGDLALVNALDEATVDFDAAGFLGWVGVLYRVGAGLVDGDDDIVRVGLGPCQGVEPLPQAATDDQYSGGFGVDNQAQRGWLVGRFVPFPASARGSGRVHDARVPEPVRFMLKGDREAARSDR